MGTITTSDGTDIFYKDWGQGQPVVFSHGWPLNADAWDDQAMLVVPGVGVQRPAVAEQDRLPLAPVLVEDCGAVAGGDRAHQPAPCGP